MVSSGYQDCFVCRKHRGLEPIPGGSIYEDDIIYISHAQIGSDESDHYLGHIFVEPKRHVPDLGNLTDEEAKTIGIYVSRLARALKQTEGADHVYSFVIGDHVPHVHVHVICRYPGAPREYWGPSVDDWPDAPRGTDQEIKAVADRIRSFLMKNA